MGQCVGASRVASLATSLDGRGEAVDIRLGSYDVGSKAEHQVVI